MSDSPVKYDFHKHSFCLPPRMQDPKYNLQEPYFYIKSVGELHENKVIYGSGSPWFDHVPKVLLKGTFGSVLLILTVSRPFSSSRLQQGTTSIQMIISNEYLYKHDEKRGGKLSICMNFLSPRVITRSANNQ